uniref:SCP domain-containing protein n=1 Tax=Angiostrongylus cantonensis TaxID=6313 RepID=A0A0K0CVJ0_ANGCA
MRFVNRLTLLKVRCSNNANFECQNELPKSFSYYYWQLDYWKRRGIPGPTPTTFFGNMNSLNTGTNPAGFVIRKWTREYGKIYGIQEGLRRTLVVSDVNMAHELFSTKFDCFHGRKVSFFFQFEGIVSIK